MDRGLSFTLLITTSRLKVFAVAIGIKQFSVRVCVCVGGGGGGGGVRACVRAFE